MEEVVLEKLINNMVHSIYIMKSGPALLTSPHIEEGQLNSLSKHLKYKSQHLQINFYIKNNNNFSLHGLCILG